MVVYSNNNESPYLNEGIETAKKVAWKYAKGNHALYEELLSEAYIGLVKAINTFDESKGFRFKTYAGTCITNQIRMYFRYQNKHNKNFYLNDKVSTDKDGNDIVIGDLLYDTISGEKLLECETKELEKLIMDNLNEILPNEIMRKVFLLRKKEIYTQQQISEIVGVSRSYVSRLYNTINKKIIKFLNKNYI